MMCKLGMNDPCKTEYQFDPGFCGLFKPQFSGSDAMGNLFEEPGSTDAKEGRRQWVGI